MGVGKTAVSQCMKTILPDSVFLDGDWCWDSSPFHVTDETKAMVMDNICHTLNNFISCSVYENVIFCWVMHEQRIIDDILGGTDCSLCSVRVISLLASNNIDAEIIQRLNEGIRTPEMFSKRSVKRIPLYDKLKSEKIITDGKTVRQIADEIIALP